MGEEKIENPRLFGFFKTEGVKNWGLITTKVAKLAMHFSFLCVLIDFFAQS